MKKRLDSIYIINRILVLSFFVLNSVFLIIIILLRNTNDNINLQIILLTDILVNLILLYTYIFLNNKYTQDFEKLIEFFKKHLDGQERVTIPEKSDFNECNRIATLMKRSYIKGNLVSKDLKDFKEMFKRFIPKDIFDKLGYKGYEKIVLGSCLSKKAIIMFLDIMGFTRISETMTPERSLFLLNIYFDGIGEIIYKKGGYIDKFLGDGTMIIFEHDNADEALMCALEIQDFIKRFQISVIGKHISIGIGINYGDVIMGTVGTKKRMDATAIGDNVNIASRLQGLTRKYERNIILSQSVVDIIKNPNIFSIKEIGEEVLNGKTKSIKLYSMDEYFKIDI